MHAATSRKCRSDCEAKCKALARWADQKMRAHLAAAMQDVGHQTARRQPACKSSTRYYPHVACTNSPPVWNRLLPHGCGRPLAPKSVLNMEHVGQDEYREVLFCGRAWMATLHWWQCMLPKPRQLPSYVPTPPSRSRSITDLRTSYSSFHCCLAQ